MRVRIDPRHEASARRLRDRYVEEVFLGAVIGLNLAIRRAAARISAFAAGSVEGTHGRGASCRS
jgi:hypothetical protein